MWPNIGVKLPSWFSGNPLSGNSQICGLRNPLFLRDYWGFPESESPCHFPWRKLKLRHFHYIYLVMLCQNINNRFAENQHILENKKVEGCHCFYSLQDLCHVWLCKGLDSNICSCIQSVICCFRVSRKNPPFYSYVVGKQRSTLIAFTDNCGHSSLILHPHSIKSSFLTITWNLESIVSINKCFICCYIKICG